MMNIRDATDYVIVKLGEGGIHLNVLKLHKLLYYCQAWNLAFGRGPLFPASTFQAWVHGPVSRDVYDRFVATKALYSHVGVQDIQAGFDPNQLDPTDRAVINSVLNVYAGLTGDQLEEMTHREDPWLEARAGVAPTSRSENIISNETMQRYYGARLPQ